MGKLLFVNTNRTNGVFGVVLCAAAVAAGVWFALGGAYAGLLLVPVGLFAGKFFLKMATARAELYEQGFVMKSWFGSATGRYGDLQFVSRFAVRANGVLNTHIYLVTQSGEKTTITKEALGQDDKMSLLLGHACGGLANTWMKTLERQKEVAWLAKPSLRIRKDGVIHVGKAGTDEFIPLNELQFKPGYAGTVQLCRGNEKVVDVNSASPNYFVGETLVAMLLEKQRNPASAQSTESARQAAAARAAN